MQVKEDQSFYMHHGIIAGEIWAALCTNIGAKKIVYGASTITMQLAKNLYFRFTHSFLRKAAEIIFPVPGTVQAGIIHPGVPVGS
jgi:penicillin-binding protein 1B